MNKTITSARIRADGTIVEILDGGERPFGCLIYVAKRHYLARITVLAEIMFS